MSFWTDNLIHAHINCSAENDIISIIRDFSNDGALNGWQLQKLNIPDGHEWCLAKGGVKVALAIIRSNIVMTSNVLPIDELENAKKSNAYTIEIHEICNTTNGILNSNLG